MTADTGSDGDDDAGSSDGNAGDADSRDGHAGEAGGGDARADGAGQETADREADAEAADRTAGADSVSSSSARRDRADPDRADRGDRDEELDDLREELDALRTRIDERTVHRDDIRAELKRYVRKRQRRGHATGWGPYLVLLYGTAMTVSAFYYLGDFYAMLAMGMIWLSTLGLYVFMVVIGMGLGMMQKLWGLRGLLEKLR